MLKPLFSTFLLLVLPLWLSAQQISLDFGRTRSGFDYRNSAGEKADNLLPSAGFYLAGGLRWPLKPGKLELHSGLSFNRYGATGSDPQLENRYAWEMEYLGLDVRLNYNLLNISHFLQRKNGMVQSREGITLRVVGGIASEFLLQGNQTINNNTYSLVGAEQFDKPMLFARGGLEFNYDFTEELSVYLQYLVGKSFPVFSGSDEEKLSLITHHLGIGLLVRLKS